MVGAVVVLGVGGAAVMALSHKADGSAVHRDTTAPRPAADSGPGRQPNPGVEQTKRPVAPPSRSSLDPAKAQAVLDNLFLEKLDTATARMVLDSARRFYDAAGVNAADRAYAAYVIGSAYANLKDRRGYCDWVNRARNLDPAKDSYRTAYTSQCN